MAVVCFGTCNTYVNVRVMVDYVKQAQRSCKANKSLIELRDRGSLTSTKKIVIVDMHAVILVMSGSSNILKPGCDPYTLSCDWLFCTQSSV